MQKLPKRTARNNKTTGQKNALKHDAGKPRVDLIPAGALLDVARVFTHGAKKYEDYNWLRGTAWSRYYAALMRHMLAWWGGEDLDDESGLSHLSHATCCLMILMEYSTEKIGKDDRYGSKKKTDHAVR